MNETTLTNLNSMNTSSLLWQWLDSSLGLSTTFLVVYYSVIIISMLLMGWGLYLINKKLWEKHAWLSFIPVVQYWSLCKAWEKSLFKYVILPLIIYLILAILLWVFAIMWNLVLSWIAWVLLIPSYLYLLIAYILILSWISKRTWRWGWTTAWLFFVPFIMFPVVGFKLKESNTETPIEL